MLVVSIAVRKYLRKLTKRKKKDVFGLMSKVLIPSHLALCFIGNQEKEEGESCYKEQNIPYRCISPETCFF